MRNFIMILTDDNEQVWFEDGKLLKESPVKEKLHDDYYQTKWLLESITGVPSGHITGVKTLYYNRGFTEYTVNTTKGDIRFSLSCQDTDVRARFKGIK